MGNVKVKDKEGIEQEIEVTDDALALTLAIQELTNVLIHKKVLKSL